MVAGACALAVLAASTAAAQSIYVIPPTGKWVTDAADLFTASEEALLSSRLAAFEDSTSNQIVVVTIKDLYGTAPVDYAVALGREWGVGQGDRNNGIVILVSKGDRQVFIAPGYGLEGAVTDAMASTIVHRVIIPQFKDGRFYDGISDAVDRLMLATAGEYDAQADEQAGSLADLLLMLFVLAVVVVIIVSVARGSRGGGGGLRHGTGPVIIWGGGHSGGFGGFSGGGGSFGGGSFGGGFGGFSGGGGSFGGGGAGGGW